MSSNRGACLVPPAHADQAAGTVDCNSCGVLTHGHSVIEGRKRLHDMVGLAQRNREVKPRKYGGWRGTPPPTRTQGPLTDAAPAPASISAFASSVRLRADSRFRPQGPRSGPLPPVRHRPCASTARAPPPPPTRSRHRQEMQAIAASTIDPASSTRGTPGQCQQPQMRRTVNPACSARERPRNVDGRRRGHALPMRGANQHSASALSTRSQRIDDRTPMAASPSP